MHYSQCLACISQERDNAIEYEPETELSVPMTIKPQVSIYKEAKYTSVLMEARYQLRYL